MSFNFAFTAAHLCVALLCSVSFHEPFINKNLDFFFKTQIMLRKNRAFQFLPSKTHFQLCQAVVFQKLEERMLYHSSNKQYFQIKAKTKSHHEMLIIPQTLDLAK